MTAPRLGASWFFLLLLFLLTPTARADWFESFDGGFHQAWTSGNITGVGGQSGTFQFHVVSNTLEVADPTPAAFGGAASGFGFVNETFSYLHMSAILNPAAAGNMNWDVGLAARANPANLTSYTLTVDFYQGRLNLSRIDPGAAVTNIGNVPISGFTSGQFNARNVYVEFDLFGPNLTGRAYDYTGNPLTPKGNLLAEIARVDATYAGGLSGVVVADSTQTTPINYAAISLTTPLRGTFDNVSAWVPEPTTVVLLAVGAVALAGCTRFRRRPQA